MRKYLQYISYCLGAGLILLSLSVSACAPQPKLTSITIVSATPAIFQLGTTQQFTATGIYSDKSTKDITSGVIWKSSDTAVATISSKGLVTAAALGTTQIMASFSGISSSATNLPVVTLTAVAIEQKSPLKLSVKGTQQFNGNGKLFLIIHKRMPL